MAHSGVLLEPIFSSFLSSTNSDMWAWRYFFAYQIAELTKKNNTLILSRHNFSATIVNINMYNTGYIVIPACSLVT